MPPVPTTTHIAVTCVAISVLCMFYSQSVTSEISPLPDAIVNLSKSIKETSNVMVHSFPTNTIGNLGQSIKDTADGVVHALPAALPSFSELLSDTKNLVAGYPVEVVLSAVNMICSAAVSAKTVHPKLTPAISAMHFILMTRTHNYSIPLQDAHSLWHHPHFNESRPTVVLVTGWTSNINKSNSALTLMYEAYMCRGGINFVAIDTAQFVDTLYEWSALNTEEIGKLLGDALKELVTFYPIDQIHLIGHSLGAHICGAAGRTFNELTEKLLPRITGLDPANPCFSEGQTLSGLSRGDALYVDVIHSNPGALGKRDPLGDVDFYPNGINPLPPGCYTIVCAHGRSYEYYAESVYLGNEHAFLAVKCHSLGALNSGFCKGPKHPMGFLMTPNLKGNFFLKTNDASPYGTNSTKPDQVRCNAEYDG